MLAEGETASIVSNDAVRRVYLGEAFRL
jgi:ABC-type lipopolysaccharide export system ATPase subunit